MTNTNPFRIKNDLAKLSNSLQTIKLSANALATHLSPFGQGRQAAANSPRRITFRPSI